MIVAARRPVLAVDVFLPEGGGGALAWKFGSHPDGATVDATDHTVIRAVDQGYPEIASWEPDQSAVAWPCFRGSECRGVVRLACGGQGEQSGAFELWRRNDRGELALSESWYANLERLERVSPHIKFPRRAGLPGKVWEDRFPRVLGALGASKDFVRVAVARSEQLNAAVGVPFMRKPPELDAVLLMLSTNATPLTKAMEVWAFDPESRALKIVSADYNGNTALGSQSRPLIRRVGEGVAGRVFERGAPWLTNDLCGVEFPRGDSFVQHGFETGVGIPVYVGADLVACVNLYL